MICLICGRELPQLDAKLGRRVCRRYRCRETFEGLEPAQLDWLLLQRQKQAET